MQPAFLSEEDVDGGEEFVGVGDLAGCEVDVVAGAQSVHDADIADRQGERFGWFGLDDFGSFPAWRCVRCGEVAEQPRQGADGEH